MGLAPGSSVLVVGGGIVGSCSAYALAKREFDVLLVTSEDVGDGASAGNAGLLVPPDSVVWASPANARSVPATLLGRGGSSIKVDWRNKHVLPWGLRFLASSRASTYDRSCRSAHLLSRHSLEVLSGWTSETGVGGAVHHTGMLFLADSADGVHDIREARRALEAEGESFVELTHKQLAELDRAYSSLPGDIHALYAPGAAHGDSRAVARLLTDAVTSLGGRVLPRCRVEGVTVRNGRAVGVRSDSGALVADAVVLAAGTGTTAIARTAGVHARILPVKGYAATVQVAVPDRVPRIGGVLESKHVAFSRMGDHLRLSTGAEVGARGHDVPSRARELLEDAAQLLFPGALDWGSATFRAEHRPMTPHGLALVGPTTVPGLYLNAGHGSLGWTQAAGSADVLAHLIAAEAPPIDPTPFLPYITAPAAGIRMRLAT